MTETTRKTWLEVALNCTNGPTTAAPMPATIDAIVAEAIACVRAGAAIVHVHAPQAHGAPTLADAYHRIIAGVRDKVDAIIYSDIALQGAASEESLTCAEELAKRGVLEWVGLQAGSFNLAHYDKLNIDQCGSVRGNSEQQIRQVFAAARRHQLHPVGVIHEPGFMRMAAALHWRESTPALVYRLVFSRGYTFSFPPEDYGVTAYLNLLDQVAPGAQWMLSGIDTDVLPLVARAVIEGGHVRVGVADAPAVSTWSNLQWVEQAAEVIQNCGTELADADDVRRALAPEDHPDMPPQDEPALNS
jgi:3-keto-5-aminohexanoate cleavage enzyme